MGAASTITCRINDARKPPQAHQQQSVEELSSQVRATFLYLRHGCQLATQKPSMSVITKADWAHVKRVHKESQHFHSDFAHSDYEVGPGRVHSWSSPVLDSSVVIRTGRIHVALWLSTNASPGTACRVKLSKVEGEDGSVSMLCDGVGSTNGQDKLPGLDMMRSTMNGGYAVLVKLELELSRTSH